MKFISIALMALLLAPAALADHPGSNAGLSAYEPTVQNLVHRLPDVQASFADWETTYPNLVYREVIGLTGIGQFPLESIRITDESMPFENPDLPLGHKFRIYLDGGHHGNEFLGVDLVMYYLEQILDEHAANQTFLATHELYATPIVNVEGNFLDTRKNANQVDVNRNYDYQWGGPGSGGMVTDLNYRGPSAMSEPEVAANAAFAAKIHPDLWITMHTGVAEFYWPWGWTFEKSVDWEFFEGLEAPFEAATNGRVDAMVAAELYLAAGATDDWGYGVLGVPTHTFEVHEDQFVPVYGNGVPAEIQEQLNGLDFMVRNTAHMGATLETHDRDGAFHVQNIGWGRAENVTINWDEGSLVVPRINASEMFILDPAPASEFTVTYRQLLIEAEAGKDRMAIHTMQSALGSSPADNEAGAAPVALVVVALALLARRR